MEVVFLSKDEVVHDYQSCSDHCHQEWFVGTFTFGFVYLPDGVG